MGKDEHLKLSRRLVVLICLAQVIVITCYLHLNLQFVRHLRPLSVNITFADFITEYKLITQIDVRRCVAKKLFIFVITALTSFDQRELIRQTWAHKKHMKDAVVWFVVGQPMTSVHENLLSMEHAEYEDLIRTSIPDGYNSTALKVYAGYHVHQKYCSHIPLILRADDDVIVIPDRVVHFIDSFDFDDKSIYGIVWDNGSLPNRDPNSKWYL
ncbi:hypothetical protein QR680_016043 [Steinernema hermaphroditum]|uniref:Hexosyltransferase n=1 Tax=Steinernema hermaphroditum TaxID=289476 RepID=A0AA39HBR6_9BILA|nr:hypothetical protein QR680_016043 [Steinernema hermaphroditum]